MSSMLTTVDNPYNPFTHFEEWYAWDVASGYNSCSLIDRVLLTSEELSPSDQEAAREQAIDEIVEFNVSGVHKKVTNNSAESTVDS